MQILTNFREYRRGLPPPDWKPQWGASATAALVRGYEIELPRRAQLQTLHSSTGCLTWNAVDSAVGRADQECLVRVILRSIVSASFEVRVLALRVTGRLGFESGYELTWDASGVTPQIKGYERAGGVRTLKAAVNFTMVQDQEYWLRFRANATTFSFRAWADGTVEPGGWTTFTSAAVPDGSLGIMVDQPVEVDFCFLSAGTGGDSAPGTTSLPRGIGTWASDHGAAVELTVEIETFDPSARIAESIFYSTVGRSTGPTDFPAFREMAPLLVDAGSLALRLGDDVLFAGRGAASLGSVRLKNPRNVLTFLMSRTIAGRRLTVRAGERYVAGTRTLNPHRAFEVVYCAAIGPNEPAIDADIVEIALLDAYSRLDKNMARAHYTGIQTAVTLNSGAAAAPHIAAYDLQSFTVMGRFLFPAAPTLNSFLLAKFLLGVWNFGLYLEAGTGLCKGMATTGAGAVTLSLSSSTSYCDGAWHDAVFAVDGTRAAYLMVDGTVLARTTPSALVDMPNAAVILGQNFLGQALYDARLYNFYLGSDDALAHFTARADADDPGVVGMWRCDDALGLLITDYSSNANPATISGGASAWIGTNRGQENLAGNPMPILAGAPFNATAPRIDDLRARYRVHDSATTFGTLRVKAKGLPLVPVTDFSDLGDGTLEMVTPQSEPVTFDVQALFGNYHPYFLAPVVQDLLARRMGYGEADLDPDAFSSLDVTLPYRVGALFDQETTGGDMATRLLGNSAAHYRLDRDGRFVPGTILPPVTPGPFDGQPALEFVGLPRGRVNFGSLGDQTNLFGSPHTVAAWVKTYQIDPYFVGTVVTLGNIPPGQPIVSKYDFTSLGGTGAGYYLGLSQYGQGQVVWATPGALDAIGNHYLVSPAGTMPWGVWMYLVAVYDPALSQRRLYAGRKGGTLALVATQAIASGGIHLSTSPLELGGSLAAAAGLIGSVQHAQVWGTAQTLAQAQAFMTTPPLGNEANLRFYAPLTDGTGDCAVDLVSAQKGSIAGARWAPRAIFDFRRGLGKSKFSVRPLRPAWDALVTYAPNLTQMKDADIAGTVTNADRVALKQPNRQASAPSRDILADYLQARQIPLTSPVYDPKNGRQLARNLRYRFHPRRVMGLITDAPRDALPLVLGDEIWVFSNRFYGFHGAAFRVVGNSPTLQRMRFSLDLWGDRLEGSGGAILADDLSELLVQSPADTLLAG